MLNRVSPHLLQTPTLICESVGGWRSSTLKLLCRNHPGQIREKMGRIRKKTKRVWDLNGELPKVEVLTMDI